MVGMWEAGHVSRLGYPRNVGVSLELASENETTEYLCFAEDVYTADLVESGVGPLDAARRAAESYARFFPGGRLLEGQRLFKVENDGSRAGFVWIGPYSPGTTDHWWVWDIVIDEGLRGKGIGKRALLLAEAEARAAGAETLGLNVFTHNTAAVRLYQSLGFETTSMHMRKPLRP